jgi:hypothetical protein
VTVKRTCRWRKIWARKRFLIKNPNFYLAETENVFVAENWRQIYEFLRLPAAQNYASPQDERNGNRRSIEFWTGDGKRKFRPAFRFSIICSSKSPETGNIDLKLAAKGRIAH